LAHLTPPLETIVFYYFVKNSLVALLEALCAYESAKTERWEEGKERWRWDAVKRANRLAARHRAAPKCGLHASDASLQLTLKT